MSAPTTEIPGWIPPDQETEIHTRLTAIRDNATLGYPCDPRDAHFAATVAISLINSRRETRADLAHISAQLNTHERKIAELTAHLQGNPTP